MQFATEDAVERAAALGRRATKPAITVGRRAYEVRRDRAVTEP